MDLIFSKIKESKIKINEMNSTIESEKDSNIHYYIDEKINKDLNIENIEINNSENPNPMVKTNEDEPIKELTPDGIPTIKQQLKDLDDDEKRRQLSKNIDSAKEFRKNMLIRVKSLCLDKMGKDILTNTTNLTHREREKLIKLMNEYTGKPTEDIINDFNDLCNEKLFEPRRDYSTFPVYDI